MQNFFKSKTMIFGSALSILGVIQMIIPQFAAMFDEHTYGVLTASIGAAVMILRSVTEKPLNEK